MRRRSWHLQALLFALVVLAGFLVWLTYHPESPVLEVRRWPWVGESLAPWLQPAADRLRNVYGRGDGAKDPGESAGALPPEIRYLPPPERPHGMPGAGPRRGPTPMAFEWLQEGAQARRAPEPGAEVVATAGEPVRVTLRERRGEWARVRLQRQEGWVHLPSAVSTEPPLGRDPLPPGPLPGRAPEPEVLEQALEGLPGADEGSLGPFLFYTDVEAPELLRFLGAVATRVEGAYGRRTGLLPRDQPRAAVVLYSREEAYRDFQQSDARLAGLDASGHAGSGVVAFYRQGRSAEELGGTLVHELTHLLNRRAIGPALPLWLDEGLSEDLGLARLSPDGVLEPGSWSGAPRAQGSRQLYSGGQAAVLLLRDRAQQGTLLPLRRLTTTDGTDFTGSRRSDLYAQSALFVRFLMDGDPALEPRFRDFLQGVAAGGSAGSEALGRALDRPWAELDQDFRAWVLAEAARVETGAGGSP